MRFCFSFLADVGTSSTLIAQKFVLALLQIRGITVLGFSFNGHVGAA